MLTPTLNIDEFIEIIKKGGWEVVSNEYYESHNRIIFKKGEGSYIFPVERFYHFPVVVQTCKILGISAPAEHQKCYDQYMEYKKSTRKTKEKEADESEE